jgi:hypothetical protein
MIFRNPGPGAYGTLTVDSDVDVNIAGRPFKTSRISYELDGKTPKIVYEHGILIRDYGNNKVLKPIPPDNHSLYDKAGNIYIPIVNLSVFDETQKNFSTSSLDSTSLTIFPYPGTEKINPTPPVTITLETKYPTVWTEILKSNDYTTASVTDNTITLVNTEIDQIYLPEYDEEKVFRGVLYSGIAQPYRIPPGFGGAGGGGGGGGGLADNFTEDTTNVTISGGPQGDGILDLELTNNNDRTIAMEFMRLDWSPDSGYYVTSVKIGITKVTSSSSIHAEEWFILTDDGNPPARLVEPGETINIDITFGGSGQVDVHSKHVIVDILLSDGTIKNFEFDTPSE